jgi:peptidoglycan/LPS O-acetylase OafA/YrhL
MRRSYYRTAAVWFGAVMTLIGILGLITQGSTSGNHLFGLFYVDTSFNVIYLATGILALAMAAGRDSMIRSYFKLVAVVYAVWAIVGLFSGSGQAFGFINNNGWDVALNAIVAIVAGTYGWSEAPATEPAARTTSRDAMAFGEFQDRDDRR